jgi:capsule polysaccharide export protein KpsE/RkpR
MAMSQKEKELVQLEVKLNDLRKLMGKPTPNDKAVELKQTEKKLEAEIAQKKKEIAAEKMVAEKKKK